MVWTLTSSAFKEGDMIPKKYTCQGPDVSPDLSWGASPNGTQSIALIMDDPDAPVGTWVHWVIFNISPNNTSLPEGVPTDAELKIGAIQGRNDFRKFGYGGPCPPHGLAHQYRFTIYALDKSLDLNPGASKKQLIDAIKGHILAQGQLIGTYQR